MTDVPYEDQEDGWDDYEDDQTAELPARRIRPRWWGRATAALLALLLGAIGFYAGVRVEKSKVSSSSSTSSGLAALIAARSGAAGSSSATRTGSGASGFGALAGRGGFAGAFGGSGGSSFGTVSSISGNSLYVAETGTGNVVKVTLSSATKISKSVGVDKSAVRPGDTVVVQGAKGSDGTISATSVNDTGASGTSSTASSSNSSSGSALNSLFGGGG